MPLSSEMRDKYTEIIDTILAESDLNTISEKRIRKGLQEAVGYDLTPQKTEIKQLIMERFDRFAEQNGVGSPEETTTSNGQRDGDSTSAAVPSPPPSSSPVKRQASSDVTSEPASASPPAKKHKSDDVDADAMFAARLQAEENSRARPTRGGNSRRAAAPKKKTKKAKTSTRVRAEDDSDIGSGSETKEKKEVNRNTGFHKPLNLSEPLCASGRNHSLSRPQTVKKVWQYIRENELQDPSDRRQIRCDDAMRAVFKQDRVHMFTMTKILNQNLYNPDE
ncbi:uncharacterized protein N7446_003742 [Penicillium canescens]|uniref:uncharacterized protein n=1 Tax=Penicillium canescens TaxID=5083 RepID=UPI0026E018D4|nr:uncharacterized protein N7446_003742 [Penicillium canescens]KAJ6066705.1 hypothetical protein N7446_003742 [Penicillium canescens]